MQLPCIGCAENSLPGIIDGIRCILEEPVTALKKKKKYIATESRAPWAWRITNLMEQPNTKSANHYPSKLEENHA